MTTEYKVIWEQRTVPSGMLTECVTKHEINGLISRQEAIEILKSLVTRSNVINAHIEHIRNESHVEISTRPSRYIRGSGRSISHAD